MKTQSIQQIRDNLAVILGHKAGCLPDAIAALDELKDSAEGHLGHYLSKRSYQKAWVYLDGDKPESGICGR